MGTTEGAIAAAPFSMVVSMPAFLEGIINAQLELPVQ